MPTRYDSHRLPSPLGLKWQSMSLTPADMDFIAGKQNSGFELATGLLPWARQIVLASPSTARLSVDTRSLVGVHVDRHLEYDATARRMAAAM